ncbi:hypothetical protein EBU71_13805, partial [bacterium]|nr:hypothetical protein [Candidatus Elulimicrobium humile]
AQDVSNLDSGETIWGEITKQLGENASQAQIQQEVENYLQSQVGQESIFELAKQTEGGRELLSQWDIDNIGEMSSLSKDQLYEVSKYLGEGELKGLTELSLDALKQVASTEFTENLSKALGTTNLTEAQLQEVIHSFATSEQGSFDLYNQITSNEEGARFLSGFGVNKAADFTNIRPDRLYEIAQTVGVDNLNQLPGFELNEIILSKFEDAPDVLNLVNGAKPLTLIDSYIAQYAGDLPGSRSIGKLALEEYVLNTDQGRKWLYDAIVYNEDKTSAGAENLQKVKELFSRESIKSPDDLKRLLVDSRGYPSARLFWDKLSWVLKPGPMPGINKALQLVLTKQ